MLVVLSSVVALDVVLVSVVTAEVGLVVRVETVEVDGREADSGELKTKVERKVYYQSCLLLSMFVSRMSKKMFLL